jgi:O-antigen ligase
VIVLQSSSGRPGTAIFDYAAYVFILTVILSSGHYLGAERDRSYIFFKYLITAWGIIYAILYLVSFFTPTIMGFPLRYYNYYSPLVDNVHQAASITCGLGFVMFYFSGRAGFFHIKLGYIILGMLFVGMALEAGSTKASMGIVAGFFGMLIIGAYNLFARRGLVSKAIFLGSALGFLLTVVTLNYDLIMALAIAFFTESDGQGAREALYSVGFRHGMGSPFIGFGPGSHAPWQNGFSDAHNTLLTVFLQSGLIGVLLFLMLMASFVKRTSVNLALFGAACAFGIYVLGGDILRRLPIWIIVLGLWYFSDYEARNFKERRLWNRE